MYSNTKSWCYYIFPSFLDLPSHPSYGDGLSYDNYRSPRPCFFSCYLLNYTRLSEARATPLPPWATTASNNWQSPRYPNGVLLAHIHSTLKETRYEKLLRLLVTLIEWMAGDVISFHVFGQVVVVLNSIKATKDLFERRGEIYSSRPAFTIHEMYVILSFDSRPRGLIKFRMQWEWVLPVTRYTEYWRRARKLLDRGLRPGAISTYRPLLQTNTRILLTQLLETPDDWEAHLV
jgi:hypothetical protein